MLPTSGTSAFVDNADLDQNAERPGRAVLVSTGGLCTNLCRMRTPTSVVGPHRRATPQPIGGLGGSSGLVATNRLANAAIVVTNSAGSIGLARWI